MQETDAANHVHVGVVDRVVNRFTHVRVGRVMIDQIRTLGGNNIFQVSAAQVDLVELRAVIDIASLSRNQVVHDDDVVTALNKRVHQVRSDKSGAAGDEDLHSLTS